MSLKNRFKVESRGNSVVAYDTEAFRCVRWFNDVLRNPYARKEAEACAAEINNGGACEHCGRKLQPGEKAGNHVRGEHDDRCDACFGKDLA